MCQSCQHSQSGHRPQSQSRFSHKDQHEMEACDPFDDSKWYTYEQESSCIQFTTKNLYSTMQSNVVFDEIDNEDMPRVLANLQVAKCDGPHNSLTLHVHDVCTECFKIDSGACGNLIPLYLYLELFPKSNVHDLKSTMDHCIQLVAYNKNLIKQYGTCCSKIKPNNRAHVCKFYIVDSHFNPIVGVGSCLKLGLILFQSPVYTGWNDGKPVSIGVHAVDRNSTRTMKDIDGRVHPNATA